MLTTLLILALGMARLDWYTFEPEAKNFRVELPDKPNNTSNRTINNAAGRSQLTTAQLVLLFPLQLSSFFNRGMILRERW
jgi:hypothetical protein